MNTRADIEQMLNGYFARFPEDRTKKTAFTDFVAAFDGPALYNRKNFTGHITAGGIVVSRQSGRILLRSRSAFSSSCARWSWRS